MGDFKLDASLNSLFIVRDATFFERTFGIKINKKLTKNRINATEASLPRLILFLSRIILTGKLKLLM